MSATVSAVEPTAIAQSDDASRNRLVIGLLLVAAFVVILNETVMGVALPRLMEDLHITATAGQWLTSAFMLTMAVVIPITGFLIQRLTTRAVFLIAMVSFCLGTLICALAPGFAVLLVGRVVQAVGTAIMMPLLMTTVMTLVAAERRGRVMGNISIVISVAPALGPTISGIILHYLDWRWMFWLVLPVALAALALGYAKMRNVTETRAAPLDILSVILSAFGFGGLVYGLSAFGGHGGEAAGDAAHAALPLWVAPTVGAIAVILFILRQLQLQRHDRALLDLRTFAQRDFTLATVILGIAMMSLFGGVVLLPILMQSVMGLTTLQAGLLLLPGGLVMGLLAPPVGRFYDRVGPKPLVLPGAVLTTASQFLMAQAGVETPIAILLAAHVVLSIGLAMLFTPLFSSGMGALPSRLYSHGSAMIGTVQQVAGAAGIAALVSVMSLRAGEMLATGASTPEAIAGGIQSAFMIAAVLSLAVIVAAFFLRKPEGGGEGFHGGH